MGRAYQEVLNDVVFNGGVNDGCVRGHCVLRQILSLKGMQCDSDSSCYGSRANDGCPVKLEVERLGTTPFELVFSKFIAQFKHEIGKRVGFDIHSDGAFRVFKELRLERQFGEAYERYMTGEIEVRDVYGQVVREYDGQTTGTDLVARTRQILGNSIIFENGRESYKRDLLPSMFFG